MVSFRGLVDNTEDDDEISLRHKVQWTGSRNVQWVNRSTCVLDAMRIGILNLAEIRLNCRRTAT